MHLIYILALFSCLADCYSFFISKIVLSFYFFSTPEVLFTFVYRLPTGILPKSIPQGERARVCTSAYDIDMSLTTNIFGCYVMYTPH